jgi:hypothetical protein
MKHRGLWFDAFDDRALPGIVCEIEAGLGMRFDENAWDAIGPLLRVKHKDAAIIH